MSNPNASLAGSIGAHVSWANTEDRTARTANGRAAMEQKFLDEADGDPVRAAHLKKAYYRQLAMRSAEARRKSKLLDAEASEADGERQSLVLEVSPARFKELKGDGGEEDGAGAPSSPVRNQGSVASWAFNANVGTILRRAREQSALTQAALAARFAEFGWEIHPSVVAKVEAGERPLRLEEAVCAARALGLSGVGDLVPDDPQQEARALAAQVRDAEVALERVRKQHREACNRAAALDATGRDEEKS